MSPLRKAEIRRLRSRERAIAILKALGDRQGNEYQLYRELYLFWCSHNSAVPELRPLFQIPGIEPDGMLSVTIEFKERVCSLASEILPLFTHTERKI